MTDPLVRARQTQRRQQRSDRARLQNLARQAGLDPSNSSELATLWGAAIKEAQAASALGGANTPAEQGKLIWDVLERWAKDGAPGTLKARDSQAQRERDWYESGPGSQMEPYEITRTQKRISITDPDTARTLIDAVLRRELGRKPSDSEVKDFVAALNKKERDNPTITTTVEQYGADNQLQGSTSTTEGGAPDPGAFASTFTDDQFGPEGNAYRAGTEYNAVMEALVGTL
jgi:hypothetical protein